MARRVEGHGVGELRRHRRDLGLGGDLAAVGVEHRHAIALGEPPRQFAHDQVAERIHPDDDARRSVVGPDRHVHLELMAVAHDRIGRPVHRAPDAAGELEGGLADGGGLVCGGGSRRALVRWHRAEHVAFGRQPQDLHQPALLVQQAGEAGFGFGAERALREQFATDLLQIDLVAVEVKTQVLLHPQHIVDQRGALLVGVVGARQPHQRGDGGEEERQAQIGQVLDPALAARDWRLRRRGDFGLVHGVWSPARGDGVNCTPAVVTHADIHNSSARPPKGY